MVGPYIPPLVLVLVIQAGIFYGLLALGAEPDLILCLEMVWLCAGVWITLALGEHLEHRGRDRGE